MRTWLEELILERKAQNSNVYLVETLDFNRIKQFKEALTDQGFQKAVGIEYEQYVEHDIQRQTIIEFQEENKRISARDVPIDAMGPYATLDKLLRGSNVVCLIKYVILPGHAEVLSNVVVPWSHDDELYGKLSTVVIFTASLNLFNDNVRRLCCQITVPPSSAEERQTLLTKLSQDIAAIAARKYSAKVELQVDQQVINASSGLTLHDTETAALESYHLNRSFQVPVFTGYKVKILKNYGIEWIDPKRGFESVGGYAYLKDYAQQRIISVIKNPEIARKYGLDIPRGMLLFGPPGTGKTYFAKAMAKEIGLPMLKISPADFLRGIVGESEARVKQITGLIETLTPCLVFIDEFDQLAMSRQSTFSGDSGVSRRMQNMLLDWLGDEDRKAYIIGATNFIDLDPAFIRPGRIDEIMLVLPPDDEARSQILQIHVNSRKIPTDNIDYETLSKATAFWSGAELERLVKEAAALAMGEKAPKVTQEHFTSSIKSFQVNRDERVRNINEMVAKLRKLEQVNLSLLEKALSAFNFKIEATDSRIESIVGAGAVAL
ncbi:ATP-binding protein [Candidatus Bathyarchaeota archaeon]|nr:ATP-binding protein [Candidatus Bathyarchaeota archaeon]